MFKKVVSGLILFLLLSSMAVSAVNAEDVAISSLPVGSMKEKIDVTFPLPQVVRKGDYDWLVMENCSYVTSSGYPMLPVKTETFKIPEESNVTKIDVTMKHGVMEGSFLILPAPNPTTSGSGEISESTPDPKVYGSNELFPKDLYVYREAHGIDAETGTRVKYVIVNFFPLRYSPAENRVDRAENASVTITYTQPPQILSSSLGDLKNLIVTSPALEPYALQLASWKNGTGVPSTVLTTTSIYYQYGGIDRQEQIRNCIKGFVATYGISYVTIFGDADQVPVRYAYVPDQYETYIATDLYYADLDGTWDNNRDGVYADQRYDTVDGLPEVYVGRIPVSLAQYAQAAVDKIKGYQRQSALGQDWAQRIVLAAGTCSGDGFSNRDKKGNAILNDYIANVVSDKNIVKLYETAGNLSTGSMASEINKGALLVNFAGHGDPGAGLFSVGWLFYWVVPGLIWNGFGIADVQSLTNGFKLPVVTAMSCSTARFDDTDCLGEWFVAEPHGGSIAYFGATRVAYGYFDDWAPYGYMGAMDRMLYENFHEGHTKVGEMWASSIKEYVQTYISSYQTASMYDAKTLMESILLGDPTIGILGDIYIKADGTINPTSAPIQRQGDVYRITANISSQSIIVERDNIILDGAGFSLNGPGQVSSNGVTLSGRSNVTVRNVQTRGFSAGVELSSSVCTIVGNTIEDGIYGVYASCNITGNSISSISLYASSDNLISRNNIGELLIYFDEFYYGESYEENECSNNTVSENNITRGVTLSSLEKDNRIVGNNIDADGRDGVILEGSKNCLVSNNNIRVNGGNGIDLYQGWPEYWPTGSEYNTISENKITVTNGDGLAVLGASDNIISKNTILVNNGDGLHLGWYESDKGFWSLDNLVFENSITATGYDVRLTELDPTITRNYLYHNNFLGTHHVYSENAITFWDDGYPSGGNYWSGYAGSDANNDGIGDAPYVIDASNIDHYPLMKPWTPVLFADGFDSGSFSNWSGSTVTSGETRSVASTLSHHGGYSASFASNGGGGTEYAHCYKTLSSSDLYVRGYFYVSQSGIVDERDRFFFIVFRAGTNGVAFAGWRRIGGVVKWCMTIRDATGFVDVYSSLTPSTGRWYCVELHWFKSDINGLVELYVDGTRVCSVYGRNTVTVGDVTSAQCGLPQVVNCGATRVYCDCCVISKAYVGPETSTAIFDDGYESGSFSKWTSTTVSTGETRSVVTSLKHHGSYCAMFTSNGGGGTEYSCSYKTVTSSAELYARGYFYISKSGIVDNYDRIFSIAFRAGSNTVAYAGWRKIGGVVKWCLLIKSGTSSVFAYSTASPALGRWYCVELHWKSGSTDGLGELWVDGVRVCSITGKNTAYYGNVNQVRFGLPQVYNCASTTVYCDCAKVAKTYVGPES